MSDLAHIVLLRSYGAKRVLLVGLPRSVPRHKSLLTYGAMAQDVSELSSLIKMRRPRTSGCAQVGLEATA